MLWNHRIALFIWQIVFSVYFIRVCYSSERSIICRRNGFSGVAEDYIDCALDEFTQKLNLLPKPPLCGVFNESSFVPQQVAHMKDFPWTVLLQYSGNNGRDVFSASGVLINYRYVVTSGFLVSSFYQMRNSIKLKSVRIGEYDISTDPDCQDDICSDPVQNIEIEEVIIHPEQAYFYTTNDIALIRLKENVTFSDSVSPICLPIVVRGYTETEAGRLVYVSGWGSIVTSDSQLRVTKKQNIVLNKIDSQQCSRAWYGDTNISGFHKDKHVCAAKVRDADNCQGFGGGALMQQRKRVWIAEGITTHSGLAWCSSRPGLYTKISAFQIWLVKSLKP